MEIQREPLLPTPSSPPPPRSSEEHTLVVIPLTPSPESDRDTVDHKPKILVTNDANNNGIPERDRNTSQTKSHVCQECGKTFVTKASLKVKYSWRVDRKFPNLLLIIML